MGAILLGLSREAFVDSGAPPLKPGASSKPLFSTLEGRISKHIWSGSTAELSRLTLGMGSEKLPKPGHFPSTSKVCSAECTWAESTRRKKLAADLLDTLRRTQPHRTKPKLGLFAGPKAASNSSSPTLGSSLNLFAPQRRLTFYARECPAQGSANLSDILRSTSAQA